MEILGTTEYDVEDNLNGMLSKTAGMSICFVCKALISAGAMVAFKFLPESWYANRAVVHAGFSLDPNQNDMVC